MNMKKVLLAGAAMLAATAAPANASIVDNPHFKVLGLVIVWGDNNVVNDFVVDTHTGTTAATAGSEADLIAGNVTPVVTGSLTPGAGQGSLLSITNPATAGQGAFTDQASGTAGAGVLDAGDSFTSFTLDATTDLEGGADYSSTWFAASNTPFNVVADVGTPSTTGTFGLDDITYDMTVTSVGANATTPAGTAVTGETLDQIDGDDVWVGTNLTADTAGSILSQAWSFTSDYGFEYDLSMGAGEVSVDVTYTVYVP